jgi:hypothetical protein
MSKKLVMIGLPETGKTTYLEALDDLLQRPPSNACLRSDLLSDDRTYIESHKIEFRSGRAISRTNQSNGDRSVKLHFAHPLADVSGYLVMPDVSGEDIQRQWTDRRWTHDFVQLVAEADGFFVFLRADLRGHLEELSGGLTPLVDIVGATELVTWKSRSASLVVQVVELLQFLLFYGAMRRPTRVAVMFSAWDTVLSSGTAPPTPLDFLRTEWALLHQFLESNTTVLEYAAFGVSAMGGTEAELQQMEDLDIRRRAKLAVGERVSNELDIPVRWLMGMNVVEARMTIL